MQYTDKALYVFPRWCACLIVYTDLFRQSQAIRLLVTAMCESGFDSDLLRFSFTGLQDTIDSALEKKCQSVLNIGSSSSGPSYHKLLYAWRLRHGDVRGAASILHDRLRRLQSLSSIGNTDNTSTLELIEGYLALLNMLASLGGADQAWILTSGRTERLSESASKRLKTSDGFSGTGPSGRQVVTLADVRKEYQLELDSISRIESGQFSILGGPTGGEDVL
jgi:hypothetical protein